MQQRSFAVSLVLLLALPSCGGSDEPAVDHRARSLVLFTIDTLRADHLGCYGNDRGLTPNMDSLAAEGLLFQNPYSQASHTHAAVSSMLTGLYPHHTGVLGMSGVLAKGVDSVAQAAQRAGLATASFASSHCSPGKAERTVWHDGWDVIYCMRDDSTEHWDWDRRVTAKALEWMNTQQGPFFCWIHLIDPHGEHIPPPKHWDAGEGYWSEEQQIALFQSTYADSGTIPPEEDLNLLGRLYDAEVEGTDDQLGRVLQFLAQRPDQKDIAVIFSADHGEELFESSPRYGHGRVLTEAVLRVPLIVRAPGVPPGVFEDPVETLQVAATIHEILDLPLLAPMDGPSLLSAHPSRGYAISYYGNTVTIRSHDLRGWLNSDSLPGDPMSHLYTESDERSPVPWFTNKTLAARFTDVAKPYRPTYLEPGALNVPELTTELWEPLQRHLAGLHPVPELRVVELEGDFLKELQDMGYVGKGGG